MIEPRCQYLIAELTGRIQVALRFLLLILLCGFVASCAANPVTGKDELMLVSEEEEIKIGNSVYRDALWSAEGGGGEYQDAQLKRYLEGVVMRLHKTSHRPNLPLTFSVQNSSVPECLGHSGSCGHDAGADRRARKRGGVCLRHGARGRPHLGETFCEANVAENDAGSGPGHRGRCCRRG